MRSIHSKRIATRTSLAFMILIVTLTSLYHGTQATSVGESKTHAARALFDLATPAGGPFPSDRFTIPDSSHNTGRRINLPLPDCAERPSDCEDLKVLNTLDGFNLQPRLSVPFDGPIDLSTVNSDTVFLVSLGSTRPAGGDPRGTVIGINQVVWDSATNTLHVESDELLTQHTRYAIIVTNGVHDEQGVPVTAALGFRRLLQELHWGSCFFRGELCFYRLELIEAMAMARQLGIAGQSIVTASVFTTQSTTAVMEKIRDQIKTGLPDPADFRLGPGGTRTVFPLNAVTGITFNQQTRDNSSVLAPTQLNVSLLRLIPGAVGTIAFGKYLSPDFQVHPGEFIPPVGTRTGNPVVQRMNEVYFNLYLPAGPKPAGGWPVAIFGHGNNGNKNGALPVAATMASNGIATIAINVPGHGLGPLGTLTVNQSAGAPITFSAGGRGIDQNGDHIIGTNEGSGTAPPHSLIFYSDGVRQTAADLMQLVRVIETGLDVDGDGERDLAPTGISYFGFSLGGNYGLVFLTVEPNVRVGVLNVPGGPINEYTRLSPVNRGRFLGVFFAARVPSLINPNGATSIGGVPVGPPFFNENLPLRNQPPVINSVAGAQEIQALVENLEWASQAGDPVAYARHLRKQPLTGVPAKSVIVQFTRGDQTVTNPTTTALLRAGELADRATFFRNDLAFAENSTVPKNPHGFMALNIVSTNPLVVAIARGAQEQIAVFFKSDGTMVIRPEPSRFFEVPIVRSSPEELNFIP